MKKRFEIKDKLLAAFLSLAIGHLSLAVAVTVPQISAKLITSGAVPVTVNGNSTQGGATILSGAVIETPDNVVATIQVGDLGELELQPGSIAVIEFDGKNVKVTLRRGCARLTTNKGATGAIVDSQGNVFTTNSNAEEGTPGDPDYARVPNSAAQSDGKKRRSFPVCGIIPAGSAVAQAAAPAVVAATAAAGLSAGVIAAIIGGIAGGATVVGIIGTRGGNPSPPRP
jgi:hypothetical protein